MKSIRQIALEKDEPNIQTKDYDFDEEYYPKQNSLFNKAKNENEMTLKISVPFNKIGIEKDFAESCSETDFNKAEEYALKELKKLAGNDFEEKYSYSIEDCLELWNSIDLEIVLTPN